jgi:DNA-binding transcriptional MocR family regulator
MLLLKIVPKSITPIYRQIITQISDLIEKETIHPGERIPASREMAAQLGLNRSTVYRAYQELQAFGYLESRPGSYMTVRKRKKTMTCHRDFHHGIIDWSRVTNRQSDELFSLFHYFKAEKSYSEPDCINFSRLDMDHRLMPVTDFRRCLNQVLIDDGKNVLEYGDYAGYYPLREYIAQRMQIHGITTVPEEILITNGSQQALDLILKMLTIPGNKVAVEAPTYSIAIPLFLFYRVEPVEIEMKNEGLDLDALEKTVRTEKPVFLYTIPNFQNPTGITTSQDHREKVLSICESYNLPLVEDGFEEEMKYFGKVSLPIKSMDRNYQVLYLGTFSKVLFPGIRVGWIVAEKECIERLTAIRRFSELSCNTLTQAALNNFCRQGYYGMHIKRMHRIFRKRMQTAFNALSNHMPQNVKWTKPEGGYTIWLELPAVYNDKNRLQGILSKHGVIASPGEYYFARLHPKKYLRLSIATLNENEITKGIKRLGQAIDELCI